MAKRTMRKYLRKPHNNNSGSGKSQWKRLYKKALERATASGDSRVHDLKHWAGDPEKALRRLSIASEVDLNREFPL